MTKIPKKDINIKEIENKVLIKSWKDIKKVILNQSLLYNLKII